MAYTMPQCCIKPPRITNVLCLYVNSYLCSNCFPGIIFALHSRSYHYYYPFLPLSFRNPLQFDLRSGKIFRKKDFSRTSQKFVSKE